jgi:restriction system protein
MSLARRRGFFAELQYLSQQAEKHRRQQEAAAARAHVVAVREAKRAAGAAQRARAAAVAASAKERDRLEKEAARLHMESRMAEAASMNADLAQVREEIEGILAATLAVDDFVDLEALKVKTVEHPPFDPGLYGVPNPPVAAPVYPPEPVYREPPPPGGLIGAKKKHAEAIAAARADYGRLHLAWQEHCRRIHASHVTETGRREEAERLRLKAVAARRAEYQAECQQREAEALTRNQAVQKLINDLAFDVESAVQEYVGIVLSNSVYPEAFSVDYDYEFDLASRELRLAVTVPPPSAVPTVKEYRYVKARDEIASTALTVKARKDMYAGAVTQVAVRTLHEVFEADRGGKIHSVALTVGTDALSPATGLSESVPLVTVAAEREDFRRFDLSNVVPRATLEHLGAAISRSPFDLVPADTSPGVRVRKR